MRRLFRQFSFPGGIPSHVAPETPGSIHEGGELGYALVARLRRRVRQPGPARRLRRRRRRGGDGAARGAAGTRTSSSNPARDGAVLPILHLNGYKIANPTVLARIPRRRAARPAARATGYEPYFVDGDEPERRCTSRWPATLDAVLDEIRAIQRRRATTATTERPRWPMIVLRTPKGWTGPEGGRRQADRGHVALAPGAARRACATNPSTCAMLEDWLRSYRPEELFDDDGALRARARRARARGRRAHEREPARQRRAAPARPRRCPTSATTRSTCRRPARPSSEATRVLGELLRDVIRCNHETFRLFGPDETASNRLERRVRGDRPHLAGRGRAHRRAPRPRRPRAWRC